ncbi:hypothetical protein, partial (plasmid) [Salmonella enterica subsp. enterica serovar Enteritidis]
CRLRLYLTRNAVICLVCQKFLVKLITQIAFILRAAPPD